MCNLIHKYGHNSKNKQYQEVKDGYIFVIFVKKADYKTNKFYGVSLRKGIVEMDATNKP